jgi:hypothetical protein
MKIATLNVHTGAVNELAKRWRNHMARKRYCDKKRTI